MSCQLVENVIFLLGHLDHLALVAERQKPPIDHHPHLVGGIPTPLKNMKVNGKDDIPYTMEHKK